MKKLGVVLFVSLFVIADIFAFSFSASAQAGYESVGVGIKPINTKFDIVYTVDGEVDDDTDYSSVWDGYFDDLSYVVKKVVIATEGPSVTLNLNFGINDYCAITTSATYMYPENIAVSVKEIPSRKFKDMLGFSVGDLDFSISRDTIDAFVANLNTSDLLAKDDYVDYSLSAVKATLGFETSYVCKNAPFAVKGSTSFAFAGLMADVSLDYEDSSYSVDGEWRNNYDVNFYTFGLNFNLGTDYHFSKRFGLNVSFVGEANILTLAHIVADHKFAADNGAVSPTSSCNDITATTWAFAVSGGARVGLCLNF